MSSLSNKDFRLFQSLVHREAGIFLSDQKRALLIGRLAPRMRTLEITSFAEYYDRVINNDDELTLMLDAVCTNETHFFREPKQFEFLEQQILPAWRGRNHVRVWSAGCSTGEEPYSLAMTLSAHLPGTEVEILASDLSTKVLDRAALGIWPIDRAEEIPVAYRKAFMLRGRGAQEGKMAAREELLSMIEFERINLHQEPYPVAGKFDLIFCRNVLIYFDATSKNRVIDRLLDRLEPHGYLFLGHSESLNQCQRVRAVGPTVYAQKECA